MLTHPLFQLRFEEKTGEEPVGCIIEPDNRMNIISGFGIAPGAVSFLHQEGTACVFYKENSCHVAEPANKDIAFMQKPVKGVDQCTAAIDREHDK